MTAAIEVTGCLGLVPVDIQVRRQRLARRREGRLARATHMRAAEAGNGGSGIHDVLALLSVAKPRATATNGSSRRTSIACPGTASDTKVRTARLGAATSQSLQ